MSKLSLENKNVITMRNVSLKKNVGKKFEVSTNNFPYFQKLSQYYI